MSRTQELDAPAVRRQTAKPKVRRINPLQAVVVPVVVVLVVLLTFIWVGQLELDSIEQRSLNPDNLIARTREHLILSFVASIIVAVTAVPLGILLDRARAKWVRGIVLGLGSIGQATPAVGIIILIALIWQTGFTTALIAIIVYSFLPVLRNTVVGLEEVDPNVTEAATGMGMRPWQVLFRIKLPLAVPVIAAGLRTSLVFAVSVATIGAFIAAGGLGEIIISGLKLQRMPVLIVGAVLVAAIAVLVDWLAGIVEEIVRPRGL